MKSKEKSGGLDESRSTSGVTLPRWIWDELGHIARETDRSRTRVVERLLERALRKAAEVRVGE